MRMLRPAGLLAVIALGAPHALPAQAVPNLSGTWVLQTDKSDFGMIPVPQSQTVTVDHQEPKLTIKRVSTMASGDPITTDLVYGIDGKPYLNTTPQGDVTSTLKWEGTVLVVMSTATLQGNPVSITDRYTLSGDGQTLTQNRTISVQGQEIPQTMVYAKKP